MDQRRLEGETDYARRLLDDAAVARRFQRRLREVAPHGGYRAPVLYDESGYPLDRRTSLTDRVRRLITG